MNIDKMATEILAINAKIKELEAQKEELTSSLKNYADKFGIETLAGKKYYFTYKEVEKFIADTDKLKSAGIYEQYAKRIAYFNLSRPNVIK